jgi:hypothetical protein
MADNTKYYPFLPKGSSLDGFKTVSNTDFAPTQYGEIISGSYAYSSSISTEYFYQVSGFVSERRRIYALKNTLNSYLHYSQHYAYSSSLGNKADQALNLINIPSIFYGSSIDKGSIELSYYISGTLVGKLQDINKNGELIQTTGALGLGQVAGVVLYNEGFIVLTGSWKLDNNFQETLIYNPSAATDYARWINWGAGLYRDDNNTISASFDLNFEGVNYINTVTMFAHADKGELNHSNNPTYVKYLNTGFSQPTITNNSYSEYAYSEIKNVVKYSYENFTGSLEKQTFISKIGIYDENKNLIAIAKLAKPIKKTENRDFTFKLKLDI